MIGDMIQKLPGGRRLAKKLGLRRRSHGRQFLLDALPKGSVGAEIGVHIGDFSALVLESVVPRTLHLIDPWQHMTGEEYEGAWYGGRAEAGQKEMDERHDGVCRRFAREIATGQVQIHRGASTDVLEAFADDSLDWVYIDGDHTYEFVKQDLECSLRKVRAGGVITGDDYVEGGWWEGGVIRAVDEFAQNAAVELVRIHNHQFILRKR